MKTNYTAVFKKRGKWFVGWIEELPGVNTQGRTLPAARANLREALALILKANRELSAKDAAPPAIREVISIEATR